MRWPELIETARLVLRLPGPNDADAIFNGYARDPEVVRYLSWRPHRTIADTREHLERLRVGWETGTELTWALTTRGDDQLIGMIGLRPQGFKPDIGYVLARSATSTTRGRHAFSRRSACPSKACSGAGSCTRT